MRNFLPPEVTVVPFDAGQETSVGAVDSTAMVLLLIVVIVLEAVVTLGIPVLDVED